MSNYFCNFLGKNKIETYGLGSIEVSPKVSEKVQPSRICRDGKDIKIIRENDTVVGEEIDIIGKFSSEKLGCSEESLVSTDSNPIIVVATKGFKIYKDIPTYIKYIPVKGGVLVALIKGAIGVVDEREEVICLNRNQDTINSDIGYLFSDKEIRNLNILVDKESDVKYSDNVVNDVIISLSYDKNGGKMQSCKFNKENFVVLNSEVFEKGKLKKLEKTKIELEKKKKLEEDIIKHNELMRLKAKEEAEKQKEIASQKKETTNKVESEVTENTMGARGFLDFIESLKSEA